MMEFLESLNLLDWAFVINLIVIFIAKVVDNVLGTGKTILIQKNRGLMAAFTVIVSQVIFYKIINVINDADSELVLYVVAVASGVGTYLAILISDKLSKERLYINVIMSDDKDAMVELRDFLKAHKITNLATEAFTKDWNKTIAITAYAETKAQSKILDKYILESETKFKRVINKA